MHMLVDTSRPNHPPPTAGQRRFSYSVPTGRGRAAGPAAGALGADGESIGCTRRLAREQRRKSFLAKDLADIRSSMGIRPQPQHPVDSSGGREDTATWATLLRGMM